MKVMDRKLDSIIKPNQHLRFIYVCLSVFVLVLIEIYILDIFKYLHPIIPLNKGRIKIDHSINHVTDTQDLSGEGMVLRNNSQTFDAKDNKSKLNQTNNAKAPSLGMNQVTDTQDSSGEGIVLRNNSQTFDAKDYKSKLNQTNNAKAPSLDIPQETSSPSSASESDENMREISKISNDSLKKTGNKITPSAPVLVLWRPKGRLGNAMFEYASALGIANANNMTFAVDGRFDLRKHFKVTGYTLHDIEFPLRAALKNKQHDTKDKQFKAGLMSLPHKHTALIGYLQSFKYFKHIEIQIRNEFQFRPHIQSKVDAFFESALTNETGAIRVGVHVRRGDILNEVNRKLGYEAPPAGFYERAMHYFRKRYKNVKFVICSDDQLWARMNVLPQDGIMCPRHTNPWVDMGVLSACNHTIFGASTFGWWGAFLTGGEVIYYGNHPRVNSMLWSTYKKEDHYLPEWISMT